MNTHNIHPEAKGDAMSQNILIVEDDPPINNLLKEALEKEGFTCEQAFSGTEARLLIGMNSYALILLDLMLPGICGSEVLSVVRNKDHTPVIVLTAKDSLDDKVDLLLGGADDYITKPFEIKEVIARISVQLRHSSKGSAENGSVLTYKNLVLDRQTFTVTVNSVELPRITRQEFAILELLVKHPKRVFSKDEIFEYAWDEPFMGETKTLDVHISNIRKKIKQVTDSEYIETVWGIGYKLY